MAENWEVYQPTNWSPGDPITEFKMDKLEEGVQSNRDDAIFLKNQITDINTTIGSQYSTSNTIASAISGLQDNLNTKLSIADAQSMIDQGSGQGTWAKTEIIDATTNEALAYNGPYDSLRARFRNDEVLITALRQALGQEVDPNTNQIRDIYSASSTVAGAISRISNDTALILQEVRAARVDDISQPAVTYESLYLHLRHINDELDKVRSAVTTILGSTGTDENNHQISLTARFAQLQNLIDEVEAAHRAVEQGEDPDTLVKRFEAIESRIQDIETDATLADQVQAIVTEIHEAHLMNNNVEGTLDSRFDAIDGGSAPSRTLPSIITEVNAGRGSYDTLNARFNADETNINHKVDKDNIYNDLDYVPAQDAVDNKVLDARQGKVLKDAIDTINSSLNTANTGLVARVSAAEGAITTLNGNASTSGSVLNTVNTQIAAVIADAPAAFDTLKEIADWISDHSDDALEMQQDISDNADAIAAIQDDLNTAETGIKAKITALESTVDELANEDERLDGRLDMIDGGEALTGSTLVSRVGAAESAISDLQANPASTTEVISVADFDELVANEANSTKDYLVGPDEDDLYKYYHIIETSPNNYEKVLISGGGSGTGTSSVLILTTLPPTNEADVNVDYYIGNSSTGYIHYRYINDEYQQILPKGIINNIGLTLNGGLVASEIGSETNKLADFVALKEVTMVENKESEAEDAKTESYTITFTDTNGDTYPLTLAAGGGGSGTLSTASLNRVGNGNLVNIIGETCNISFTYYATDGSGDPLATASTATWYVNRAQVATTQIYINDPNDSEDYSTFDITQYLNVGDNNITLIVTSTIDDKQVSRNKNWFVDVKNFALVWDYDESTIQDGSTIDFSCVPSGTDITKTLHLKVGAIEETRTVTTSGIPITMSLNNTFDHGAYTAEMWMTATINSVSKETPHIFHDFLVVKTGNNTPIIASTLPSTTMDQYNTLTIPFIVYTPNSNISTVALAVDGTVQDTREVGRTTEYWNYTPLTSGNKVLTITSGGVVKALNLTVNSININNEEVGGYAFKLKASELPSNNALKTWCYDSSNQANTSLQFSSNFDWINGGIKTELDDNNQLRSFIKVKSGTTMTIPYKMFATDPRTNGGNFKIVFKVENCRDYDAIVATNVADNIGIQLKAHGATFHSTTTEITTQYGEEEYTELEFEVYKQNTSTGDPAIDQYMMAWVDGVITTARAYGGNFVQSNENASNFIIGSDKCDVCVYLVKYYPTVLSRNDHITNFIADAPNAVEMIQRYNRNDILDANEDIDYNKLAQKNRDCRVWLYDIDRMTKAKDDLINVNQFQQIWENGDQYYQLYGTNAKLKIQGTSSFNYRYGAANTDIDFGKKKAPNATLVDGYGNNLLADDLEYKGFKINDNSLPITYSNTKVNFASCEQVNNMCNAEWYQRYQPFPSLSARDCMEFAMGVQFIKDRHVEEPTDGIVLFTEKGANFNPEKYYMYSIANMGTSKKNTHIFHSEDECCIEIKENTTEAQKMKAFDADWVLSDHAGNYEIRYPDIKPAEFTQEIKDGWERFVRWMVSCDPNAATNSELNVPVTFEPYTFKGHNREITQVNGRHFEQVLRGVTVSQYAGTYTHDTFEYRMAKMLSECEDYMAMDSVIYHFCFIERHTMVDNVAKNTFWSSLKEVGGPNDTEGYWIWDLSKNYDNDTSDGNNNNGLLIFDYGNEAHDTREGTPVFNGHDAVWFVFASNLYEACRAMFVNREAIGAWNSVNYHNYLLTEQRKVPERVWNECYWYDYLRTYEQSLRGDTNVQSTWINFLDGGQKIHQRKHYETYEEIYDSSKYRGSFSHNQSITLRGEAIDYQTLNLPAQESKFRITMFNKCYLTIWIGTNYQTVKCEKGVPVELEFYEKADEENYQNWTENTNYTKDIQVNYNGIRYICSQSHTSQSNQTPDVATTLWTPVWLSLSNSVIDIDSGSMVQEIGDLSLIYPSSGQFAAAKRLRLLQIGSNVEGYYNPNMNNNSVLTFNNKMLEYLYVQNLPQATYNLDLSNCPELRYLDAKGSGFTGFVFANGGLLNEAYLNRPVSLIMRNLDLLTLDNFTIIDPTAVTQLRLEGCKLFNDDKLTFIQSLTNLNILRLTDIDWILENDVLLDNLLTMMGIDEFGYTTAQSYLAGNITLYGTVYSGKYDRYNAAWAPDLSIDISHATYVQQHLVIYQNEDGTEVYRTYTEHGNDIVDPVAEKIISEPTKAADIRNVYSFGSVNSAGRYIAFTGWRKSTESNPLVQNADRTVNDDLVLIAVFTATPQQYTVRWLMRANAVVAESTPQNYGGGQNLVAPTIQDVQNKGYNTYEFSANGNLCTYRIMTGWEKLPTNITPTTIGGTYDIYPTWLERTSVNYMTVLTSDDYGQEEKLLIYKELPAARTNTTIDFGIRDIFPIQMGYNGIKEGIDLVASPIYFTEGDSPIVINDYMPFAANKSFTIAIDYRFDAIENNIASEAVLISCYSNANSSVQGFKLFYNPKSGNSGVPQVSFGSTSSSSVNNIKSVGNTINNRNIIVLRHRAGESDLYVYSGAKNSGLISDYTNSEFRQTCTWSGITSDAKIVLGGIISNDTSMMNAHGTLYSVRYWEEDLGEGECFQLASWCHETMYFAVADYTEAEVHSSRNGTLNASVVLHTVNASQAGTITETNLVSQQPFGWEPSAVRTFYNNRIYHGLPVLLQSIMHPLNVPYNKAIYNGESYVVAPGTNYEGDDYVFAASFREVGNDAAGTYSIEANGPYTWHVASTLTVKTYSAGALNNSGGDEAYTNLRFPYYYNGLNANTTVYVNYPLNGQDFYTWMLNENGVTLSAGDILITDNDPTNAYIYVTANDINNGAPIIRSSSSALQAARGGWVESRSWWTRSVPDNVYNTSTARFIYINGVGRYSTSGGNIKTHGIVYSIGL